MPSDIFSNIGLLLFLGSIYLGFLVVGFVVFSYVQARQRTYVFDNTTLDGVISMVSRVRARGLAWVSVSNLILLVVTLGLAKPWAAVRMARYLVSNTAVDTQVGFDDYVSQQQESQSALADQLGDAFDVDIGIGI